jgi:enolase
MKAKKIDAKVILDSRGEKTIEVSCISKNKILKASSPSGKSTGSNEKKPYVNSLEKDILVIKNLSESIEEIEINNIDDLENIEELISGKIGANSLFALECVLLKSLANENQMELWEILNSKAKTIPHPIGNCIGGGLHSKTSSGKKPDFQEFLFIPKTNKFEYDVMLLKRVHNLCSVFLDLKKSNYKLNDENAWTTALDNEEVLSLVSDIKSKIEEETKQEVQIGVDFASSSFYKKDFKTYMLKNPLKHISKEKYQNYINELIKKYKIYYNEDVLEEENFDGFSELLNQNPNSLIVGDDLTVSNSKRLLDAIRKKSINAIIVKPNQVGSLLEIKNVVNIAKNFDIKIIFSHRSGETLDNAIADLAFAFEADYVKFGVFGKERECKLKRLIEIERDLLDS